MCVVAVLAPYVCAGVLCALSCTRVHGGWWAGMGKAAVLMISAAQYQLKKQSELSLRQEA